MNIGKINAFNHGTIEPIVHGLHSSRFFFASTYRIRSAIFKRPARFTPVSFDRQDRRTPARHPGSNKATGRVSEGHASQQAYACLANKVLPWIFTCNTAPIFTALKCMGAWDWLHLYSWCMCMWLQLVTKKRYSNALLKCVISGFDRLKKQILSVNSVNKNK